MRTVVMALLLLVGSGGSSLLADDLFAPSPAPPAPQAGAYLNLLPTIEGTAVIADEQGLRYLVPLQGEGVFAIAATSTPGYGIVLGVDQELRVVRNGQEVPTEQIRRDGDRIVILDEQGNTALEFRMSNGSISFPADSPAWTYHGRATRQPTLKPRIGITMVAADPALCAHLELDPEQVVMIGEVIPDLPAAHAGLQAHDVIIAVNGELGVTLESVRSTVEATPAGQTVHLRILRRGVARDLVVKVEAVPVDPRLDLPLVAGVPALTSPGMRELHEALKTRSEALSRRMLADEVRLLDRSRLEAQAAERVRTQAAEGSASLERLEARLARLEDLLQRLLEERAPRDR